MLSAVLVGVQRCLVVAHSVESLHTQPVVALGQPRQLLVQVEVARVEAENIVYCVIRLDDLIHDNIDCIFTDGHALSAFTSFYQKNMLPRIDEYVKYDDVYSSQWNIEEDLDLKRRKEAELLVKQDLSAQYVRGYVVYNETAKQRLISSGVLPEKIVAVPGYYF